MFIYAQLNDNDYCIGVSSLSGEVLSSDMILIDEFDYSYINRKYDKQIKKWTDEYYTPEPLQPIIDEHEVLTRTISETTSLSQEDGLLIMELLLDIQAKLAQK